MIRFVSRLAPLRIELLAPASWLVDEPFVGVITDERRYRELMNRLQRFRGGVYAREGFLAAAALDAQGRHVCESDADRWHLLLLDDRDAVKACVNIRFYTRRPRVETLAVYEMVLRTRRVGRSAYRQALERLIEQAQREERMFAEIGGWAVSADARYGATSLASVLGIWALQDLIGEAIGVATAGKGRQAGRILTRLGGVPLMLGGRRLPSFFNAGYNSEIDILCFDSRQPCVRAVDAIDYLRDQLLKCRVHALAAAPAQAALMSA